MSSCPKCEHLRERDYFDPDYDLRFDPHETHWCRYFSRPVIPFEECSLTCPGFMPWQQSKARPNRDAVDPYVSAQASSQSVRGLKYRFDKLTAQLQTILTSLPTIDDTNPIVPAIRSLEEQLAPLEATQQRIEAEIAAKSQSFMKLVRMRQKSLKLTVDQHLAGVEALGDAQPADPEWMAQSQKAMAAAVELMGMFLVFETPGLITRSDKGVSVLPEDLRLPSFEFEIFSSMLSDDAQLGTLFERVDQLTAERAAINHQIYLIKVERNLDGLRSQLKREIEHREIVQTIYDTVTSRGRAALSRLTTSVSNSTVGYFQQFFYEAEKIVKLLTTSPSGSPAELRRLHRTLRELPLD